MGIRYSNRITKPLIITWQCFCSVFIYILQTFQWLPIPREIVISYKNLDPPRTCISGPLFYKGADVFPKDLVKYRTRDIGCYYDRIAVKFDKHFDSSIAEVPVKC